MIPALRTMPSLPASPLLLVYATAVLLILAIYISEVWS